MGKSLSLYRLMVIAPNLSGDGQLNELMLEQRKAAKAIQIWFLPLSLAKLIGSSSDLEEQSAKSTSVPAGWRLTPRHCRPKVLLGTLVFNRSGFNQQALGICQGNPNRKKRLSEIFAKECQKISAINSDGMKITLHGLEN